MPASRIAHPSAPSASGVGLMRPERPGRAPGPRRSGARRAASGSAVRHATDRLPRDLRRDHVPAVELAVLDLVAVPPQPRHEVAARVVDRQHRVAAPCETNTRGLPWRGPAATEPGENAST